MDIMKTASDFLTEKLEAVASQTVEYVRGSDSVEVLATLGRTQFETAGENGAVISFVSNDFIIKYSTFLLSGSPVIPERGDYILFGGNKFYVTSGNGDDTLFRWQDAYRTRIRVHTTGEGLPT